MPSRAGSGGADTCVMVVPRMSETGEGTRARPLKPHESEPFLTIGIADTHPFGTSRQSFASVPSEGTVRSRARPVSGDGGHSEGQGGETASPASTGALLYSLYISQALSLGQENSRAQTAPSRMPGSTLTPSNNPPNPRVKMPFKHDIRKPSQTQWQEPAQELKEMTAMATYHMTQMLASDVTTLTKKKQGRLQKGKLKPLYPVNIGGPSIRQCRGILAETRSYSASASRTLQRRRHIVSQLKSGDLKVSHKSSSQPQDGAESVHRVSAASSVEDLVEGGGEGGFLNGDFQAELASMERDALLLQDMLDKESTGKGGQPEDPRQEEAVTEADPASLPLEQDASSLLNPDMNIPDSSLPSESKRDSDNGEARRHTQQPGVTFGDTLEGTSSPGNNITTESKTSTGDEDKEQNSAREERSLTITTNADHGCLKVGSPDVIPLKVKRPVSAGVKASFSPLTSSPVKARPQTAASVKTVRFADHAYSSDGKRLPLSKSNSWMGKSRGKRGEEKEKSKERKKSAESCKSNTLDKTHRDDNDEDEQDDRTSRNGSGRGGGGSSGKSRNAASDSSKVAAQGGAADQATDSTTSPQDVNVASFFKNLTSLLCSMFGRIIMEHEYINSHHTSSHQQSTSTEQGSKNNSVHNKKMPRHEANKSPIYQHLSHLQKLPFSQHNEGCQSQAKDPPLCQEGVEALSTTRRKPLNLQQPISVPPKQQSVGCRDKKTPTAPNCMCGKDNMEHRSEKPAVPKDRGVWMGKFPKSPGRKDGGKSAELAEKEVSAPVQLWNCLGLHLQHWRSTLLIL